MRPQRRLRGKTREKNSWKEHQRMLGRRDEEIIKRMKKGGKVRDDCKVSGLEEHGQTTEIS